MYNLSVFSAASTYQKYASNREMQLTMASLGRWDGLHIDFQDSFWDPSNTRPTIAAAKDHDVYVGVNQ